MHVIGNVFIADC